MPWIEPRELDQKQEERLKQLISDFLYICCSLENTGRMAHIKEKLIEAYFWATQELP